MEYNDIWTDDDKLAFVIALVCAFLSGIIKQSFTLSILIGLIVYIGLRIISARSSAG